MVKKSGELENINATNAAITKADNTLQTRTDDYKSSENETANFETETDDTEQIREQIVETRRDMSETIDAIQEKLSIANISEQVKDQVSEQIGSAVGSFRDATFEKAGDFMNIINKGIKDIGKSDIAKMAKQNPWVLSLVGLGVGALLVNGLTGSKKKKRSTYRYDYDRRFEGDDDIRYSGDYRRGLRSDRAEESNFQTAQNRSGSAASSAYETVSGAAGAAYESVGSAAGTAYEGVSNAAGAAYEGVSNAAGAAYEGVSSAAGKTYKGVGSAAGYAVDKAGDLGGQVKENYDYYIEESPLVVGVVALVIGAAVGYAIPLTQIENEYMGEYRDNIVEKAQASAQDAIGTVKQMAGEAQKAISDEVKSQTA